MIENIVAYIYSITGLIFFITWQMNFSLAKYFLKEKNFSKLKAVKLYRKLSQLAIQVRALKGSEKGALLLMDRTSKDFVYVEINSESLVEWSEQIASNLNNISYYIEDYKTYWDKIIHLEEGIVRDYNQEEEIIIQGRKWK